MIKIPEMNEEELGQSLASGEPTLGEYFKANVAEGFSNSTLGVAANTIGEELAAGFDERSEAGLANHHGIPVSGTKSTVKASNEEEYKTSQYYREGLSFVPGSSEDRLKYRAETFDNLQVRQNRIQRGDTSGARTAVGFVGQMVGNIPDPINFVPFGMGLKGASVGAKVAKGALTGAAENVAVSAVTRPYWEENYGVDSTWQDYVMDLGLGGLLGGGFAAAGHGVSKFRDARTARTKMDMKDKAVLAETMDKSIEATVNGEKIDLETAPNLKEAIQKRRSIEDLMKDEAVVLKRKQLEDLGYSKEEIDADLPIMATQAEFFSLYNGKSMADSMADVQAARVEGGRIVSDSPEAIAAQKYIDSALETMKEEITFAEKGGTRHFDKDGQFLSASGEGSFPSWYKEAGVKNKAHLEKVLAAKKGPVYERLVAIAEDRLINGYESPAQGKIMPDNDFRKIKGEAEALFQAAYHGTAHKFDKFSTEKIGAGVGAQRQGWGLYFAEERDIAEHYRRNTSVLSVKDQVKALRAEMHSLPLGDERARALSKEIRALQKKEKGQLYKVELPEKHELPEWDSSILDQSPEIQAKLESIIKEMREQSPEFFDKFKESFSFSNFYLRLEKALGSDKAASMKLKDAGIPGLKYIDEEAAREGRAGVHNFVIFDDSHVQIQETFYQKGKGKVLKQGDVKGAYQPDKNVISIFKEADRSTLVHETGHLILKNLEDLAESGNAMARADMALLRKEWGFKESGKLSAKDYEAFHENFARGLERYLMEGIAPRKDMEGIFARFKDWLVAKYKRLEALNVELGPGARDIYSKILGKDQDIDLKAQEINAPEPTFKSEEDIDRAIDEAIKLAEENGASSADIEEMKALMLQNAKDEKILDEAFTFFQSAQTAEDLAEAAKRAGISKREFQDLIDSLGTEGVQQRISDLKSMLAHETKIKKRNAFLSGLALNDMRAKTQKLMDNGATPAEAVLALLEGNSKFRGIEGAGNSVDGTWEALSRSVLGSFHTALKEIDPKIEKLFENDPKFSENIILEMLNIRSDGKGNIGVSGDDFATRAAQIFARYAEDMRKRVNASGGDIGKLDGWVPRRHDVEKLIEAGEQAYIDFMKESLDLDKSFVGLSGRELDDAIREVRKNFINDIRLEEGQIRTDAPLRKTPVGNIAKRFGHSRTLHFKSPEAELNYLLKFGHSRNILETMTLHLNSMAKTAAVMERLGPNPDSNLANLVDDILIKIDKGEMLSHLSETDRKKAIDDLGGRQGIIDRKSKIGNSLQLMLGEAGNWQNPKLKNITGFILSMNSASKLGAAFLSQISDALSLANAHRVTRGSSYAHAWIDTVNHYLRPLSPEVRAKVLDRLGIMADGINFKNFNRFDEGNVNNFITRQTDTLMKITGMQKHTQAAKSGYGIALSMDLADLVKSGVEWDKMPRGLKESLAQYGSIDKVKWDLIKSMAPVEVEGKFYFHPDILEDIAPEKLEALIPEEYRSANQPGKLAMESQVEGLTFEPNAESKAWIEARDLHLERARFNFTNDLRTFFIQSTRDAVLEPDLRVKRITGLGANNDYAKMAAKLLMQFKSFSFTYHDRIIRGKRFSTNEGALADWGGGAHHVVSAALLGYVSMTAKDLSKNKTPRDPADYRTWIEAFMQAGGIGILGDFARASMGRNAADFTATLAGPTVSTFSSAAVTVGKGVRETMKEIRGEDGNFEGVVSDGLDLIRGNLPIPYTNAWYARGAMDYLIWRNLKESLEPGSVRRSERRIKKEYGQESIIK